MANTIRNQQDILDKLRIPALNPMQEEAIEVIEKTANTVLLSPRVPEKPLPFYYHLSKPWIPNAPRYRP